MGAPQKFRCTVDRVLDHGDRVYSLLLRPERAAPRFLAGQFLHLTVDPYHPSAHWPDSRCFSIASDPGDRGLLRITYAVHGAFSRRMEREIEEGRELWVKMPYGDFIVRAAAETVLLAGGTGITAFTAFLAGFQPSAGERVVVAYGVRQAPLLIYRDLVEQSVARTGAVSALYFVERADTDAPVDAVAGQVALGPVWARLADPQRAQYYLSGPPAMLRGLESELMRRNVDAGSIHIDAWE